ncbi:MarR family transcriptional regulator [Fluviicola sp.]|uniref:MarR family winged helix-turn-helix transcriptional regulator n=1 Tax=Fluviicola sp. TaxID=1917219 RepID=UPI00260825B5|nr:MarR family transcriptional regulator [Fluviicola sp.]
MENLLKLDKQICFPIYALSREVIQRYRPLLDELDLTYPQYLVFLVLWEEDKQTVNQIGDKLLLDSGTLTPLLKRLEQKNLIIRQRKKTDERVVEIILTKEGKELEQKAKNIPEKLLEELNISLEELKTMRTIAHKILNINK